MAGMVGRRRDVQGDDRQHRSKQAEACRQMLETAGVTIIRGPVPRPGGRGRGKTPSLSLYARDPDGNLLEWMTYQVP